MTAVRVEVSHLIQRNSTMFVHVVLAGLNEAQTETVARKIDVLPISWGFHEGAIRVRMTPMQIDHVKICDLRDGIGDGLSKIGHFFAELIRKHTSVHPNTMFVTVNATPVIL